MQNARNDLILGCVLSLVFTLVCFVLIPIGIDVPKSHDPGQLSPAAYPSWIAFAGLGASLLLAASAALRCIKLNALTPRANSTVKCTARLAGMGPGAAGFALLLAFYLSLDYVGMTLGCFLLYAAFATLCGERNWLRLVIVDCILSTALYFFFVRIASVPVPQGILESFL